LFLSAGIFWYSYQVNAYTDRDDLTIAGYFINIYALFITVPESEAIITEQGFDFSGRDALGLCFILSISFALVASLLSIIHRIRLGVSIWFLPLTYFGVCFAIFVVKVTFDIGVFYT
jgi:hypothetical protein